MTLRTTVVPLLAALLIAAAAPAGALDADDEEQEEEASGPWALSLATQVDQQSTRAFQGQVGYDLTKTNTARFVAEATDYNATHQSGFKSQGIEGGLVHDFGRFSLDGAVMHWQATDIVTANELKLGGDLDLDPWSVGLRTGYRHSDFDAFATTVTGGLSASAACKLKNSAYGLDARYQGDVWGGYATVMGYRYSDTDCRFNAVDGSVSRLKENRAAFAALAATQIDRLAVVAVRRFGRNETLLDASLDAGASWKHEELVVSLDYSRQKEYFLGSTSNTYSATGTADLGDHTGVDCTIGITRGAGVTNGAFVGLAVRARF